MLSIVTSTILRVFPPCSAVAAEVSRPRLVRSLGTNGSLIGPLRIASAQSRAMALSSPSLIGSALPPYWAPGSCRRGNRLRHGQPVRLACLG
jgi:hypothetical protein